MDVSRCTALTPPEAVNCEKLRLALKKFPAPGSDVVEVLSAPGRGSIRPKAHS
jgi:hypothetical protein